VEWVRLRGQSGSGADSKNEESYTEGIFEGKNETFIGLQPGKELTFENTRKVLNIDRVKRRSRVGKPRIEVRYEGQGAFNENYERFFDKGEAAEGD